MTNYLLSYTVVTVATGRMKIYSIRITYNFTFLKLNGIQPWTHIHRLYQSTAPLTGRVITERPRLLLLCLFRITLDGWSCHNTASVSTATGFGPTATIATEHNNTHDFTIMACYKVIAISTSLPIKMSYKTTVSLIIVYTLEHQNCSCVHD